MNVMKKAWEIAKQGQKNFGGKVKEYFSESLKLAWSLAKKVTKKVSVETLDFFTESILVKKENNWSLVVSSLVDNVETNKLEVLVDNLHSFGNIELVESLSIASENKNEVSVFEMDMLGLKKLGLVLNNLRASAC